MEDHDLLDYAGVEAALQQSDNLLPSQSATLAAWKHKLTQYLTLKYSFQTLDLEITPYQLSCGFPSQGISPRKLFLDVSDSCYSYEMKF